MKDIRGMLIEVGDLIAWGVRSGNTGKLSIGIVAETKEPDPNPEKDYDKRMQEHHEEYLHGEASGAGGWVKAKRYETEWYLKLEDEAVKLGRKVKLVHLDRIVVVEKSYDFAKGLKGTL